MAAPGNVFRGRLAGTLGFTIAQKLFQASNRYAAQLIARHKEYAAWSGLARTAGRDPRSLEKRGRDVANARTLACCRSAGAAECLENRPIWTPQDESYRKILRQIPFYQRAIQTGLPFPKTRRVVFEGGHRPAFPAGFCSKSI